MAEACSAAEVLASGHCSTINSGSYNGIEENATSATSAAAAADGETVGTAGKLCEVVAAAKPTAAAAEPTVAAPDAVPTQTGDSKQQTAAQDAAPSEGKKTAASGGPPPPSTAANKKPVNSVLRSSIARYGSNSYYYAHAPLPGAAEDAAKVVKVTEAPGVVTGGPPILLGRTTAGGEGDEAGGGAAAAATDAALLSPADAAAAAAAGKKLSGFTILQSYMWTDDGARVSVYVQLEKLPESPEEKEAEPCFDPKTTAATFEEESAALVIHRRAKKYLLNLHRLYFPIKPSESRILVKNDKIVLRLVKEDENLTWFGLMKSK